MNKSFKTVWNDALGAWVATPEHQAARGKRSGSVAKAVLASAVGLMATTAAFASGFDGGDVSQGSPGPANGVAIGSGSSANYNYGAALGPGASAMGTATSPWARTPRSTAERPMEMAVCSAVPLSGPTRMRSQPARPRWAARRMLRARNRRRLAHTRRRRAAGVSRALTAPARPGRPPSQSAPDPLQAAKATWRSGILQPRPEPTTASPSASR